MKQEINTRKDLIRYLGTFLYPNCFIKPINAQFSSRYGEINSHNIDRLLFSLKVRRNKEEKKFSVSDVYRIMTQSPNSMGEAILKLNNKEIQTEDDMEYNPNFNQKSVDNWYHRNINENQKNINVLLSESQYDRLFENLDVEGGVFNIRQLSGGGKDGKGMVGDYTHVRQMPNQGKNSSNRNIYMDFSNLNLELNPFNKNWVKVPEQWGVNINSVPNSRKIRNADMPNYNDFKGFILNNGNVYMPVKQFVTHGDNVEFSVGGRKPKKGMPQYQIFQIINPLTKELCQIKCFNTSSLGDLKPTTAAHFYKGKPIDYNFDNLSGLKLYAMGGRDTTDSNGQILRNPLPKDNETYGMFSSEENREEYIQEMVELIKSNQILYGFNPTHIMYPQSSSGFNNRVANVLKKYIWPSAQVVDGGGLRKQDKWDFDYKTLILGTIGELKKIKMLDKWKYKGEAENLEMLTIMNRFYTFVSKNIVRGLWEYVKDAKTESELGELTMEYMWDETMKEYDKLFNAVMNFSNKMPRKQFNNLNEGKATIGDFLPSDEVVFLRVAREVLSKIRMAKSKKINHFFKSYYSLENALLNPQQGISLNIDYIKNSYGKKDSISQYDSVSRDAVVGQFVGNSEGSEYSNKENCRYLIIDDNLSSGVSLRNACMAVLKIGVKPENIMALTPGDMGSAGYGNAIGAAIPYNKAEGEMITNLKHKYTPYSHGNVRRFGYTEKEKINNANQDKLMNAAEKSDSLTKDAIHKQIEDINQQIQNAYDRSDENSPYYEYGNNKK